MSKEDSLVDDAVFQAQLRAALKKRVANSARVERSSSQTHSSASNERSPRHRGQSSSTGSVHTPIAKNKRKQEESNDYDDLLRSYGELTSSKRREKIVSKKKKNEVSPKKDEERFGMSVCRMGKTKRGDSYRRLGDSCRVSGFSLNDSYATVIQKAAAPLLRKTVNYDSCSLIVSQARVVPLPLESGAWTLGGYMKGLGGLAKAKRLVLGIYMPEDSGSSSSETTDTEGSTTPKPMTQPKRICEKGKHAAGAEAIKGTQHSLQHPQHSPAPIDIDLTKPEGLVIKPEDLTIGDNIGVGTWGVVCKGIYCGTEVAIKMINVPDGGLTQKTLTEVTILSQLQHTNIVSLIGACKHVNQLLIVMNYVDGFNLEQVIFQNSMVIDSDNVKWVAKQIARALAYMHGQDPIVIHQDLKPANVMVAHDYHAYVCDLGVAKLQDQLATLKTCKGPGAGTVPYKAPEMFIDAKRSRQVDIYSFGCLLIELSTKQRVWGELNATQITAKVLGAYKIHPQSPSTSAVPQMYQAMCEQCTKSEPEDRPTAIQLLAISGIRLIINLCQCTSLYM